MHEIPPFRRLGQEDCPESEPTLGHTASPGPAGLQSENLLTSKGKEREIL